MSIKTLRNYGFLGFRSNRSLHNPHHRVRGYATHPTADSTLADFRCRVCARGHARGCLIDGLPFQLLTFNFVKALKNKPFLLQHPNHKQKSYGALSQKLHCRRHILFHRQTRRSKIAPACRTYRLIACGLYGFAKTISL